MRRYLEKHILKDLPRKIVLVSGARQSGKTTLTKQLSDNYDYLNYDSAEDRLIIKELAWDRKKDLLILDELHKKNNWKKFLKGVYDTEGLKPKIIVTGSAKLNAYKNVGDSLAGRYFQYRMHPVDLKEARLFLDYNPEEVFNRICTCSGFPEPFLEGDQSFYRKWRKSHLDIMLKEDLLDISVISNIKAIETLVLLLKNNVGSTVSYANLARAIEKDAGTVKRWLQLLEDLYIIFRVKPYSNKISRSILKEPKYYFYDTAYIEDKGAQLENLVACSLYKELNYLEDTKGIDASLYFLRNKDGNEIDFLITLDNQPTHMVEVKNKDDVPSKNFKHFDKFFDNIEKIQLVKDLRKEKTYQNGVEVRSLINWLSFLELN